MEDSAIIDLYFARSEQAVRQTDLKYGKFCYKIAWNILANREDSEETVNDTYYAVWNRIPPTRPAQFPAFLAKITRHFALDCWRKHQADKRGGGEVALALEELEQCIPSRDTAEETLQGKELERLLRRFLETLDGRERCIFVARYYYLRPVKEIAASLDVGQSSIKTQLFRTRAKLQKFLKKEEWL